MGKLRPSGHLHLGLDHLVILFDCQHPHPSLRMCLLAHSVDQVVCRQRFDLLQVLSISFEVLNHTSYSFLCGTVDWSDNLKGVLHVLLPAARLHSGASRVSVAISVPAVSSHPLLPLMLKQSVAALLHQKLHYLLHPAGIK